MVECNSYLGQVDFARGKILYCYMHGHLVSMVQLSYRGWPSQGEVLWQIVRPLCMVERHSSLGQVGFAKGKVLYFYGESVWSSAPV